ncbi:MAG: YceI family protein [Ignavibacteriaceae bacterium]
MKNQFKAFFLFTLLFGINLFAQTFSVDTKDARNQAQFISDAPFEKINGLLSGLDATVMINTTDITQKPMGKVKVAIKDIKTGIDLRDEHLRSEMWLNAAKYPYAEFQLTGIKNPSSKTLNDGQKVKCTLVGKFSVHGITKDVEVPATLAYFKESQKTKAKVPGNLLVANADFNIKLSDYGIKIPDMVVGKVNDEVQISVNFVASDKNAVGDNPCGTCGPDKSKGKCNPCSVKKNEMKNSTCNPCAVKKDMKKDNPCNPCAPKKK